MLDQMQPLVFVLGDMTRPQPGHRLIFAYDLLMDEAVIHVRCPSARLLSTARILNRQFVMNSDKAVTTVRRDGHVLHGVVWEIPEPEVIELERQLEVPSKVERLGAFARGPKGNLIPVEFYGSANHRHGEADSPSIIKLVALATSYRFPKHYQAEIDRWGPGLVDTYTPPRLVE